VVQNLGHLTALAGETFAEVHKQAMVKRNAINSVPVDFVLKKPDGSVIFG